MRILPGNCAMYSYYIFEKTAKSTISSIFVL